MSDIPISRDAYNTLAEAYAEAVETKPHNALYERPATLSLLPDVRGKRVLDAGCGPGIYTEILLERGADVFAIDASPNMIELARQRVGDRAQLYVARLDKPMDFLEDDTFDLVLSPLVIDYVEDWQSLFGEFYRILRADGHLVFSIHHPFFEYIYYKIDNYFATGVVSSRWKGFPGVEVDMPSYRRTMQDVINPLVEAGFRIEKLLEPLPTREFAETDPKDFEKLSKFPSFLCVSARR
jgi:SAM-dependent methyltransferase